MEEEWVDELDEANSLDLYADAADTPTWVGDDRVRVRPPEILTYPYSSVCMLYAQSSGTGWGAFHGTGFLVTPRVVLTAAHCLFPERYGLGIRALALKVIPGFSGDLPATHSSRKQARPRDLVATRERFRAHPSRDFGVIVLRQSFQRPSRFLALHALGSGGVGMSLRTAGYPGDKPFGTMWTNTVVLRTRHWDAYTLSYDLDICQGQSGSPVWLTYRDGRSLVVGIVASVRPFYPAGPVACEREGTRAWGVVMSPGVIDNVQTWCREFGVRPPQVG